MEKSPLGEWLFMAIVPLEALKLFCIHFKQSRSEIYQCRGELARAPLPATCVSDIEATVGSTGSLCDVLN